MTKQLLQQALDALEWASDLNQIAVDSFTIHDAITALRSELAQPAPEPVAYLVEGWHDGKLIAHIPHVTLEDAKTSAAVFAQHYTTTKTIPLYATPQQAQTAPVPDGWVMVPTHPTEDQVLAGFASWNSNVTGVYAAMIAAAPVAPVVREQLTNGEIYTAYIAATNQTLRPQDERLALAFARAIEKAHGIGGGGNG